LAGQFRRGAIARHDPFEDPALLAPGPSGTCLFSRLALLAPGPRPGSTWDEVPFEEGGGEVSFSGHAQAGRRLDGRWPTVGDLPGRRWSLRLRQLSRFAAHWRAGVEL